MYSTSLCVIQVNKVGGGGFKAHNLLHVNSPPQTQGGCETNLRLSFVNHSTKASLKM